MSNHRIKMKTIVTHHDLFNIVNQQNIVNAATSLHITNHEHNHDILMIQL